MELFKDKKAGVITKDEYDKKYNELSKVVRKLEEEEKIITSNNTNDHIRKEQLKEINNNLNNESVDLLDAKIMRTLLNCINV